MNADVKFEGQVMFLPDKYERSVILRAMVRVSGGLLKTSRQAAYFSVALSLILLACAGYIIWNTLQRFDGKQDLREVVPAGIRYDQQNLQPKQ